MSQQTEGQFTKTNKELSVSEYLAEKSWVVLWTASANHCNHLVEKECLKSISDLTEAEELPPPKKIVLSAILTSLILLVFSGFIQAHHICDALQEVSVNSAKQMMLID